MIKCKIDRRQVICKNASTLGSFTSKVKPGYWITWFDSYKVRCGRVIGRITETDYLEVGERYKVRLAVMEFWVDTAHCSVVWVDPDTVQTALPTAPAQLLAWLTSEEFLKTDPHKLIAMAYYGTLSERYIASRDDPDKAYNARPEYVDQFKL